MGEASNRLDFLVRRNRGKTLVNKYREMFVLSGLQEKDLKSVDLDKSDEVLNQIRLIFPSVQSQVEVLSDSCTFLDSKLLTSTFAELGSADECYLFSDDVYYCGMFIVTAKSAQACCLNVAKKGYSNTCFLLDRDLRFSFTINYYLTGRGDLANNFDIRLKPLM